ncbi:UTRA domain-containing protein [Sinorhizobium meliloti]|uniref:UTRA domain-containing protein n=1 Tax=Rhizobium meliloti TaxID=382 RepID=UPI000314542E|nr:UTRA domain-containing protein [Sinorhizobium meliloti]MDE3876089.1 UTRA domain-containing protein [Sinorhizobium meliloti]MDW9390526.1 UTRA domain-containing protein [Sinorhizobium meliloti]MDW9435189.1 UTRA domain-containing protein [Sinorhizobium meliloti]MDW9481075.1 UTRA domain-containing protein [Sinorhizobium meliloti]MDW9548221.1 UTRA domain-containing protein [Sinorhizobium meliloti]
MPESDPHLYEKIKETIDRRVEAEEWPAEFQVPAEVELAEEFGASPLTVRRALRELQAEGVLIRIQGRGTFVVGRRMQCAVFNISDMAEEIALSGGAHTSKLINLGVIPRDSSESNMLVLGPDGVVFHVRLLHLEDGTPIQLEDRYVNATEAPSFLEQDFTKITPHAFLLRETTVTSVDNTIRAIRPDEEACRLLQIDSSQPCLLLDRSTWREGVPVTRSRFIYPGDRYRLRSSHEARQSRIATTRGPAVSKSLKKIK